MEWSYASPTLGSPPQWPSLPSSPVTDVKDLTWLVNEDDLQGTDHLETLEVSVLLLFHIASFIRFTL